MRIIKNPLHIVILSVGILTLSNSCKISKEDPLISFKSRDERITGDWSSEKLTYADEQQGSIVRIKLNMESTDFKWTNYYDSDSSHTYTGDWEIDPNDKRIIVLNYRYNYSGQTPTSTRFYLHKVSSKEFWLRQLDNIICGDPVEYKFKSE